ncbi:NAD-specific glutamate dehydrogenase [Trachymyrmex septentrionalis]|uniref:NAD-specific glutamate dehydrogenase n=1 Tax=Trachymyrmex septentrionalis TaxID=34720 RepID=A0A151JY09_9HYME|nr:NAD-specific glutamate dehydrogenase [Trachymyrmex septentrionalis]
MLKQYDSRAFLAEILSRCCSSSDRYFSASFTILSMSSFDKRPLSLVIVILFSLPVDFSIAETFNMPAKYYQYLLYCNLPLASISKVTSICGTPLGAGGIPVSSNLPRMLLSFDNGVTSSKSKSWTSSDLNLEEASEFLVSWWSHRLLEKNDKRFVNVREKHSAIMLKIDDWRKEKHCIYYERIHNMRVMQDVKKLRLTEDGVARIHSNLILRRIADQPLGVGEGYVAWCGPVTLVISDDLNFSMLEDTHTRIRGAQVDSNCRCFRHR